MATTIRMVATIRNERIDLVGTYVTTPLYWTFKKEE